jgi:predicted NAD-dependent protein-ADP-ribosyltransferase YbiA (DUF1768 family)
MELYRAEAAKIESLAKEWIAHPDYELESTFRGGQVDAVTFLAIAQRLRAKGYRALAQEDTMTVLTPEHIRFTLNSFGIIQQYCKDDTMAGKPFRAIIKDHASAESQVDLEDYEVRVKLRKEIPLAQTDADIKKMFSRWPEQRKAFRVIRRWSFEGDGVRIDMSIVRSTMKDRKGGYRWQTKFRDQNVMASPPIYEIEVELTRPEGDAAAAAGSEGAEAAASTAMKQLIKGVGEVLRGAQKHSLLLRKSQKEKVLAAYKEMTGTDLFRGPSLLTLLKPNFTAQRYPKKANIRDGYNVTDKADGLRCLGFVDATGELFLIDMAMNVYRTGLQNPECRLSLVDGEWVTQTKDRPTPKPMQQFLIFDIVYTVDKKEVWRYPFQPGAVLPSLEAAGAEPGAAAAAPRAAPPPEDSRHHHLNTWAKLWNKDAGPKVLTKQVTAQTRLQVAAKEFAFARAGDDSIFKMAARVLAVGRPYYTDGLIFTPNALPYPDRPASSFLEQFKWKPPHDNTIDFLVRFEKDKEKDRVTIETNPESGETLNFKTLRLYVGSSDENAREIILKKLELPKPYQGYRGKKDKKYKPVAFTPKEFPDPYASVCNLPIEEDPDTGEQFVVTDGREPIQENTIVEMAYDPSQPPGWRWKPLRIRMDKTERLQRGIIMRTLNSAATAEDVWNSIYDPITERMIRTGKEELTQEEIEAIGKEQAEREQAARRYFDRKASPVDNSLVAPMTEFHGRWIKEQILYRVGLEGGGEGKALLDLACGVANDIHRWRRAGAKFVLGVDYAAKNIMDTTDSAYVRYMNIAADAGSLDRVEPMIFAIADTSKSLVNPPTGPNGGTEEDKDILRAVFGRVRPRAPLPPYVAEDVAGRLKRGADCVSCMFAIHYMFESKAKFSGFLQNLNDTLKVGGYFIGCCFDGERVFKLLRGLKKRFGAHRDVTLWRIQRDYEEDDLPLDDRGFGLPIDVEFVTLGDAHREYLVPFPLLVQQMETIGCELLNAEELKAVGLEASTNTFDVSWEMARRAGKNFPMVEAIKDFSFLNRWFIFKRKRQAPVAEAAAAEAENLAAARGLEGNRLAAGIAAPANQSGRMGAALANAAAVSAAAGREMNAAAERAAAVEANGLSSAANRGGPPGGPASAELAPFRTVPVERGALAAPAKAYNAAEVFQFYRNASKKDVLGINDFGAGRYLAPSGPFPIEDPDDPTVQYPSVEHFMAGMMIKHASDKPELAKTLFARATDRNKGIGSIHQKFLLERQIASNAAGGKPLTEDQDQDFIRRESEAVKDAMTPAALSRFRVTIDKAAWATAKDAFLEEALRQRWTKDARFRKIVEAARNQGRYLLFYSPGANSQNLGGTRGNDGIIKGENKYGKIIMQLAGYPTE